MSDSSITTNPGTGGSTLDSDSAYQKDGATLVARERVALAFGSDDLQGRVVSKRVPLPVEAVSEEVLLLRQIRDTLMEMQMLLCATIQD